MNPSPPKSPPALLRRPSAFAVSVGAAVALTAWGVSSGWLARDRPGASGALEAAKAAAVAPLPPEQSILPRMMLDASFARSRPTVAAPASDRHRRSRPPAPTGSAPPGSPVDPSQPGGETDAVIVLNEGALPPAATPSAPASPILAGRGDRLVALPDARSAVVTDPADGMPRAVAVGGLLPSGARLLAVDPVQGSATTDRGTLELR